MGDMKLLQVTAAISPGSSGSPVMNVKGDVVGVASSLLRSGQALNFAVPVVYAQNLILQASNSAICRPLTEAVPDDLKDDIRFYASPEWKALKTAIAVALDKKNAADWDRPTLLKTAQALVDRYPEHPEAHCMLGDIFGLLDFKEDSLACYQRAIKLNPDYAEAWTGIGYFYLNIEKNVDAIAAFRQATKLNSDNAMNWIGLGLAAARSGRVDTAQESLRILKKMQGEKPGLHKAVELLEKECLR